MQGVPRKPPFLLLIVDEGVPSQEEESALAEYADVVIFKKVKSYDDVVNIRIRHPVLACIYVGNVLTESQARGFNCEYFPSKDWWIVYQAVIQVASRYLYGSGIQSLLGVYYFNPPKKDKEN